MKGRGVVETRKMALRVEVREIGDDPPSIFVRNNVPNVVDFAEDNFPFDLLHMLDGLVARLPFYVRRDIHLGVGIAFHAITTKFAGWHWMRVDYAIIARRFGILVAF